MKKIGAKANGEVRLCIMRYANKTSIIRERNPIPSVDEILQDKQEGVFSVSWNSSRDITR